MPSTDGKILGRRQGLGGCPRIDLRLTAGPPLISHICGERPYLRCYCCTCTINVGMTGTDLIGDRPLDAAFAESYTLEPVPSQLPRDRAGPLFLIRQSALISINKSRIPSIKGTTMDVARASRIPSTSDKGLMLAATAARMGLGLLTFVILARFLGPEQFGLIATAIAYSAFAGTITDYGLGTSSLRLAAGDLGRLREVMAAAMAVKGALIVGVSAIGILALSFAAPHDRALVYIPVLLGSLAYSFGELMLVAARANRRFDVEAKIVLSSSVVLLLIVAGTALLTRSVAHIAVAFAISRIVYSAFVAINLRRWLGNPLKVTAGEMRATMSASSSYAADNVLTTLSSQVDVLIYGAMLSLHAIGVYQSGARLVQVIIPIATVLSTVYLPGMVAALKNEQFGEFERHAKRLTWEFTALAVASAFGFAIIGPIVTNVLYGPRYADLDPLWIGFAIFALLRLTASAYGIQMVALGLIRTRVTAQACAIALLTISSLLLLPKFGLSATSWLLALSSTPPFILYAVSLWRARRQTSFIVHSAFLVTVLIIMMIIADKLIT